jgi:hypothetical protein
MKSDSLELDSKTVGALPIINAFIERSGLSDLGILSIVVDEKKHVLRKNSYATYSSKIPSTNFLPDNTMGMIEDPVSLLQVF